MPRARRASAAKPKPKPKASKPKASRTRRSTRKSAAKPKAARPRRSPRSPHKPAATPKAAPPKRDKVRDYDRKIMRVGDTVGPYTLLSRVGDGREGIVFQARRAGTREIVAVKTFRTAPMAAINAEAAWQRKAAAVGAAPAVLAVDGPAHALVMAWASGTTLGAAVEKAARAGKALPAAVEDGLLATLEALLRIGIDQHDAVADNWRVDLTVSPPRVMLLDYGAARAVAPMAAAALRTYALDMLARTLNHLPFTFGVDVSPADVRTVLPRLVAAILAHPGIPDRLKKHL